MKVLMHNIGFFLDQHLTLFRSKNLTSIIKATITQLLWEICELRISSIFHYD